MKRLVLAVALVLATADCGGPAPPAPVDPSLLPTRAPLTVLVFFSPGCHCLAAHDARVVSLATRYGARGVQFFMVDSEAKGDEARDDGEAQRRGYPFRILRDPGGRLANQVGAEFASYSVVLDVGGHVLYHGGIDSDRNVLHDDATPYLQDALDDVLAGRPPHLAQGKTLGCSLQKW